MPGNDPHPDPFVERAGSPTQISRQLLGGHFHFQSRDAELLRLVQWAYADLPSHALSAVSPHFDIRLVVNDAVPERYRRSPPPLTLMGGGGLLGGVAGSGSFAVLSPDQGGALVTVSRDLLRYPYHVRYELIEFVVFTLAARAQHLVPLHAACVSLRNRGVLLMGASGAGKSTMALHCLLRNLDFVSEDAVFVKPRGMLATGVANFLHVCPQTLSWLPKPQADVIRASPTIRRRSGVRKFEVDLRRATHRLAARPPRLSAAVFLSRRAGGKALLRPLDAVELRRRLAAAQPYAAAQPNWKAFATDMERLGGYELRRGRHPQEGADALHELLAAGG